MDRYLGLPVWLVYPPALDGLQQKMNVLRDFHLVNGSAEPQAGPVDNASREGLRITKAGSIAVIKMEGIMIPRVGYNSRYFAGTLETAEALMAAYHDDEVYSILWIVNSPGGSVSGLDELADIVRLVAAKKPILVQVDGMMASAAVYVTAPASKIYAGRRHLIGSIGARMMIYDWSKMFEKEGIEAIAIDTGVHKSAGAPGTEVTTEQRAEFQRIVDGYFSDFKAEVLAGRNIQAEKLDELADGRVFFANEEPVQAGLIDNIQTLDETIQQMKKPQVNISRANARLKMLDL